MATAPSEHQQLLFESGSTVGKLAQGLWPGGVEIGFEPWERDPAIKETQSAAANTAISAIYEAALMHANLYIRVDILARTPEGWDLIEVKSSTHPEKEVFLMDLAVQYWVLSGLGMPVRHAGILTLNSQYVYSGGPYDLEKLFKFHDATEYCKVQSKEISIEVARSQSVVTSSEPPAVEVGDHCFKPYDCPYYAHCSKGEQYVDHPVSDLYRLNQRQREELSVSGIDTIPDIPIDFPLSDIQERIRNAVHSGSSWRSTELDRHLNDVQWPLYYLDFEAFAPALPRFVGTKPYEAVPFQFSIHTQATPNGALEHHEYLHIDQTDPRPNLTEQLLSTIGQTGSIVVYSSYEKRILKGLAKAFPEYSIVIQSVIERLWDLLPIIKSHYYHPDFRGSFSIKSVLPALRPSEGWSQLEVGDGMTAVLIYEQALAEEDLARRDALFESLRAYCKQDTLAMFHVREALLAHE